MPRCLPAPLAAALAGPYAAAPGTQLCAQRKQDSSDGSSRSHFPSLPHLGKHRQDVSLRQLKGQPARKHVGAVLVAVVPRGLARQAQLCRQGGGGAQGGGAAVSGGGGGTEPRRALRVAAAPPSPPAGGLRQGRRLPALPCCSPQPPDARAPISALVTFCVFLICVSGFMAPRWAPPGARLATNERGPARRSGLWRCSQSTPATARARSRDRAPSACCGMHEAPPPPPCAHGCGSADCLPMLTHSIRHCQLPVCSPIVHHWRPPSQLQRRLACRH